MTKYHSFCKITNKFNQINKTSKKLYLKLEYSSYPTIPSLSMTKSYKLLSYTVNPEKEKLKDFEKHNRGLESRAGQNLLHKFE